MTEWICKKSREFWSSLNCTKAYPSSPNTELSVLNPLERSPATLSSTPEKSLQSMTSLELTPSLSVSKSVSTGFTLCPSALCPLPNPTHLTAVYLENGAFAQGYVKDGNLHGFGVLTEENGLTYSGQFQSGGKCGLGRLEWTDGSFYAGEFKSNSRQGFGIYTKPACYKYEGYWEGDQKHGQGKLTVFGHSVFRGSFWKDQKHGLGTIKSFDNSTLQANWQQGKLHGFCLLTDPRGKFHVHLYTNGELSRSLRLF